MTDRHIISLCGFMGCGKSCVGRKLSALLSCPLTDLDTRIEEMSGMPIPEIFATKGEKAFRQAEETALREVLAENCGEGRTVLSLGGGTVTTPECARMVREQTFCIYLKADTGTLVGNLREDYSSRPMLNQGGNGPADTDGLRSRIVELMEAREPVYESVASAIVTIDGKNFADVAQEIVSILQGNVR